MKHRDRMWQRYAREEFMETLLRIVLGAIVGCSLVAAIVLASGK